MSITTETNLPSLDELPDTFLVSLDNYSAISLTGEEQTSYLQGQVTCDVNSSSDNNLLIGAHCNAKGKVFSAFRLINRNAAHLLIQPKASISGSISELKKFGVFAKVDITPTDELNFFALIGEQATAILQEHFNQIPDSLTPVVQSNTTTLVYVAGKQARYLLIDESPVLENIIGKLNLPIYNSTLWNLLEINEGFPQLSSVYSGEYVPQMLNLQAINGISFTKGCYLGQETVARMQYLGKNKRALYSLRTLLTQPLESDDVIEKQLGENWRKAGDILTSYQADNGHCYLQAVLNSDLDDSTALRIKSQPESRITVQALPYSLVTE
ncbi:tRNA-modifying protein YgfZ [Candidatus Colwellia aromaticivorans]|uniref:tRNA-modifying protein YgfZ n=1 Tax=Candidatus Colwellia aromaticivorans TaxID=2267621 RepID=UPI000DF2BFE7|nr:tRNA-modifying protein YgfZ [Candidatus Colwellia aromaticivorans]